MLNYIFINSKFSSSIIKKSNFFKKININNNFSFLEENTENFDKFNYTNIYFKILTYMQTIELIKFSDMYRHRAINKNPSSWIKYIFAKFFLIFFKSSFSKFLLKVHEQKIIQNKINDLIPSETNKIIIISGIYSHKEFNLIKACKFKGIKTIFVIDNWDNLSSKMPFIEHPDEIILWGNEMKEIWKDKSFIFPNDDTKVHILGSYRFSIIQDKIKNLSSENFKDKKIEYVSKTCKKIKDFKNLKVISYLNSIRERNSYLLLSLIDDVIEKNFKNQIVIIFREHPLCENRTNISNLKNIFKDPAFHNYDFRHQSEINPSEFMISNTLLFSDAVISQITTALLEIDLLKKKKLIVNFGTPKKLFDRMKSAQYLKYYLKSNLSYLSMNRVKFKEDLKIFFNNILDRDLSQNYNDINYNHIYKKCSLDEYAQDFLYVVNNN